MTEKQEKIIREKAKILEWRYPTTQDIAVSRIVFDLYNFLPDRNVVAFLRECLIPACWNCVVDDEGKRWFFSEAEERRQCYATCVIENPLSFSPKVFEETQKKYIEQGLIKLINILREATDYTKHKTQKEMFEMYAEFERIREAGPPKEKAKEEQDEI